MTARGTTDLVERFAKETRSVKIAVLYEQDPLVPHNVLARTSKHNRTGGTGGHFPRVIRIGMPALHPTGKDSQVELRHRNLATASITRNSAGDSILPAIGRIS